MSDEIRCELQGHVAVLTLARPHRRNALTQRGLDALAMRIGEADADPGVRVLSIRAEGADFCVGQDVTDLARPDAGGGDFFAPVLRALAAMRKPVVCAARGELRGGGAGIVLGADVRVLARGARIGWLHARMGIGSISGPATLARALPRNIALEMMFTCDYLDAERAHALGLANHLVDDAELEAAADAIVARIAANAPLAVQAMKRATLDTVDLPYDEAVVRARALLDDVMRTEDAKEGLRAARDGRAPVWQGR